MKGVFITVEGPDGAGKTTQIQGLTAFLQEKGIPYLCTREPGGGGYVAQKIRELLLSPESGRIFPRAEALLYAADRAQHIEEVILPALNRGEWVVCDRFADSQLAYQGYGRQLDIPGFLQPLNQLVVGDLQPDITFLFLVAAEEGLARIIEKRGAAPDRMEQEALDFHQRVCDGYGKLAAENPERIVVLDGMRPIADLQAEVRSRLIPFLSRQNK
ncbi:MAG: dTMP kinase [Peptococcaceae bacterium]|jgi:dTMP kinase|nr:dTMP kinase [Peptococcaceae bacterium]